MMLQVFSKKKTRGYTHSKFWFEIDSVETRALSFCRLCWQNRQQMSITEDGIQFSFVPHRQGCKGDPVLALKSTVDETDEHEEFRIR